MSTLQSGLFLTSDQVKEMEADILSRSSEEACGLIAGIDNHATVVVPITNILHDPHRFRMDPKEELQAIVLAETHGWDIIAIYHSHPYGISYPSPTDYSELTFPGVIYLIWYQDANGWQYRAYFMHSQKRADEVPVILSTNL